jgi:quercetin dioxygenase-like cupin family protein
MERKSVNKTIIIAVLCISCLLFVPWSLFAGDYDTGVKVKTLAKSTTASNGQKLEYLKTENAEVTVMAVEIAPGKETGWHLHNIPVYAYVIAGKLTVKLEGGQQYDFQGGQPILEVMNTPHNGINSGDVPVKLIVFYTGEAGMPIVKKVEAPVK